MTTPVRPRGCRRGGGNAVDGPGDWKRRSVPPEIVIGAKPVSRPARKRITGRRICEVAIELRQRMFEQWD